MNSKHFLLIIFFIASFSSAFAAITVIVNSPNGSQYINETYVLDFNWTDSNEAALTYEADLYYSTTAGAFSNTIALNVDLTDANATNPDSNVATTNNYVFSWDTTTVTDGNYFIDVIVHNGNATQADDSSDTSFNLDNTAPATTWSGDNDTWKTSDITVTLTCTDANSGCDTTQYRLDTNATNTVTYGSWTAYSTSFTISTDGNYAIDFNSTDRAGNLETTNTVYALLDKTAATTTDDSPATWQNSSFDVTLTCSDGDTTTATRSGCNVTQYRIDSGSWTAYSTAISISTDANHQIDYNSSDNAGNIETTNITYAALDTVAPTTSWDGNHNVWQASDANVHLTCNDSTSGCSSTKYRLDTDASNTISYGAWTTYDTNILITADGNYAIDFNSTDNANNIGDVNTFYVLIDQIAPIVTISSPTEGWSTKTTNTSVQVTFNYSTTNTGDLNKYSIRMDSGDWINNGLNTTYTFSAGIGSHTLFVIATTNSDLNSSTASVGIVIIQESGGLNYCDASQGDICNENEECTGNWLTVLDSNRCCSVKCTALAEEICGNEVCIGDENSTNCPTDCPKETKEVIMEKTISKKPTSKEIKEKLTEAGASETAIKKASQAVEKTTVSRTIKVEKITDNTTKKTSYNTIMTISVSNPGNKKIQKIKVIESIPKSIALTASQIKSNSSFTVLKEDPIIQFEIEEINSKQTKTISYTVNNNVTEETANEITMPIILEFQEESLNLCEEKNCDDNNPCTTDSCNNLTGKCINTNLTDGTNCGTNQECKTGECITTFSTKEKDKAKETGLTPIIILAILIVLAGIGYYYYKIKPKNSNK